MHNKITKILKTLATRDNSKLHPPQTDVTTTRPWPQCLCDEPPRRDKIKFDACAIKRGNVHDKILSSDFKNVSKIKCRETPLHWYLNRTYFLQKR